METTKYRSSTAVEILAASLAMSLDPDELEWLWRELARRAAENRSKAAVASRADTEVVKTETTT
jgi:hypothetical protein